MTTKQCPHCFGEIDVRATACQHCGREVILKEKPKKKRRELGFLALALLGGGICTVSFCATTAEPEIGAVIGFCMFTLGAVILIFALAGGHVKLLG
jgi:hypothetical protein